MLELTPENSRRMGRNARVQIETNHSWEQVVERTEAIYSSTLSP
jgi:glycosyltransferase involved in cell wall biosynthesis